MCLAPLSPNLSPFFIATSLNSPARSFILMLSQLLNSGEGFAVDRSRRPKQPAQQHASANLSVRQCVPFDAFRKQTCLLLGRAERIDYCGLRIPRGEGARYSPYIDFC